MTSDELLAALNAEAVRLGQPPITARDLRAWVDRRLVGKAQPRGRRRGLSPVRVYSDESVRASLKIVELRSYAVTRTAALLVHLWANGFEIGVKRVQAALCSEFARFLKRRHRGGYWDEGQTDPNRMPLQARRRLEREAARLDPHLAAVEMPVPAQMLSAFLKQAHWPEGPPAAQEGLSPLLASGLGIGLLADPEFTLDSVQELLRTVTEQDLTHRAIGRRNR